MNDPATLWLSGVALGAAISAFVIVAFEKESVKEQLARIEQRLALVDADLSVVLDIMPVSSEFRPAPSSPGAEKMRVSLKENGDISICSDGMLSFGRKYS